MLCTRLAIWLDTCSIFSSAAPAFSASCAPPTTSVVLRSIETTAPLVSVWMVRTSASICLVALAARSARRCTSSATTAKPRPASPAIEAWIEAFSARMLVCSARSLISSTMLPISCELSPRRLMRLEVSWMVSRIAFMPSIVRRTASPPLCAMSTEWRATSAARSALPDTSSMEPAIARDGFGRRGDLPRLRAAGLGQVLRQRLGLAGGAIQLHGGLVDGGDQPAQGIDGHVDRIGDGAGDVFGDRGRGGQVALPQARDFVEQAQDGLLVALVLLALRLHGRALGQRHRRCSSGWKHTAAPAAPAPASARSAGDHRRAAAGQQHQHGTDDRRGTPPRHDSELRVSRGIGVSIRLRHRGIPGFRPACAGSAPAMRRCRAGMRRR